MSRSRFNEKVYTVANSKRMTLFLIVILCVWRIPFLCKGIDYMDTGYSMENYLNVFSGNGINGLGTFLTTLIGGLIYKALPAYQLLVFRILHWLMGLATAAFAYAVFYRYINRNLLLCCILVLNVSLKGGEMIFSYYPLTTLFLMISLYFLVKGVREQKCIWLSFSGLVAGLNIFVRLPNLLFLSMCLGIIWYGVYAKKKAKLVVRDVAVYALGCLCAVLLMLPLLIHFLGWDCITESFMRNVNLALGKSQNEVVNVLGIQEKSGHSLSAEVINICKQILQAAIAVVKYFVPFVVINWITRLIVNKTVGVKTQKGKAIKITVFIVSAVAFAVVFRTQIFSVRTYLLGLFAMLVCLITGIKYRKSNPTESFIMMTALLMGACSVLGTDMGLLRVSMVVYFLVPAALSAIRLPDAYDGAFVKIGKLKLKSLHCQRAALYLCVCLVVTTVWVGFPKSYNDADYSELKYSVNDEIYALRGMKTSRSRAEAINEYYRLMNTEEMKSQEVAVFGYYPLAFSISENKDYFESVQPGIDWPGVSVESLLAAINQKQDENVVPVIVVSHVNALQSGRDYDTTEAKQAVLDYMLKLNSYEIYVDDEFYTIYIPAKK